MVSLGRFFVLIDAANEVAESSRKLVLSTFLKLCRQSPAMRLLWTCTAQPSLDRMEGLDVVARHMRSDAVDVDIKAFVEHRLASSETFRSISPKLRGDVGHGIVSGANGMFRWAQLCMDHLGSLRTGRDIRSALETLPATLYDTYADILERLLPTPDDAAIAREALSWLCYCTRPLYPAELGDAVVLQESDTFLDCDCRLGDPIIILSICRGLVHLDRGRSPSHTIQFGRSSRLRGFSPLELPHSG